MTTAPDTTGSRRIVVGVDSSGRSAYAAEWVAREAHDRGVPVLHLVHAIDLPGAASSQIQPSEDAAGWHTAGARLLETISRQIRTRHPDLSVTTEVSDLSAPEALVNLSGTAKLTVAATRGHGGFAGLLLGSVRRNPAPFRTACPWSPADQDQRPCRHSARREMVQVKHYSDAKPAGFATPDPWSKP